jgi:serine/threonine-protein kinase
MLNGLPQGSDTMIGILLDQRYQVIQALGQGGFGHTYIAQDTRRPGNPTCVVKHLKPATSNPEFLQTARRLFNSEAETLEKLGNHDQIPRLLAYFEEKEEFYLVQEFIDGHPLSVELPPGQQWSESQVIQLLSEVLSILEFVHGNGVIHRDLKPDNLIRRSSDNKLVLVDFGAVKQVQMQSVIAQEGMNETVAIGTPGYMPSEQGQGRPRPSSDLYALGMIGIQALTGQNPRQLAEDPDSGEILWRHQAQLSDGLAAVLSQMVRHYFKFRYQSATEALRSLASLTNPNSPAAIAAVLSQKVRGYWKDGSVSANKALQSLQERAQPYIPTNNPNAPKSLPQIAPPTQNTVTIATHNNSGDPGGSQPSPDEINTPAATPMQNTVTSATGTPLIAPITSPSTPALASEFPRKKVLLFIGAGAATLAIAMGAIVANRPVANSPATIKNQTQTTEQPKAALKNSCVVVLSSSNVRSLDGRKKTGDVVKAGTKVSVTGKEEGGWIEINSPVSGLIWKGRTKNTCSSKD